MVRNSKQNSQEIRKQFIRFSFCPYLEPCPSIWDLKVICHSLSNVRITLTCSSILAATFLFPKLSCLLFQEKTCRKCFFTTTTSIVSNFSLHGPFFWRQQQIFNSSPYFFFSSWRNFGKICNERSNFVHSCGISLLLHVIHEREP